MTTTNPCMPSGSTPAGGRRRTKPRMTLSSLFIVVFLILVNALYVAAEFAIVGARATRVEQLAAQGHRLAGALLPILRDTLRLDRYIAACQIGITASSLILGAFGQATIGLALGAALVTYAGLQPLGGYTLSATVTLVALTSVQVVIGELIPKTVALQYPVRTALFTYLPMRWSLALFSPFIDLLNGSGNLVLRLFGVSAAGSHRHIHAPDEIDLLIRESREGGLLQHKDSERLREALKLGQHRVRQIMVPRRRIASLDLTASERADPFRGRCLPVHPASGPSGRAGGGARLSPCEGLGRGARRGLGPGESSLTDSTHVDPAKLAHCRSGACRDAGSARPYRAARRRVRRCRGTREPGGHHP